ncbi:MAG: hypothetical protein MI749_18080, partial [Desulfovibrionales bacterium]|nr:hypothetical protein [Desulfovibrionales bacterium]
LKPAEIVNAVEKGMGLAKGQRVTHIHQIRIVNVRKEPLNAITQKECRLEGFPELTPAQFVEMFTTHNKCKADEPVNRIAFRHMIAEEDLGYPKPLIVEETVEPPKKIQRVYRDPFISQEHAYSISPRFALKIPLCLCKENDFLHVFERYRDPARRDSEGLECFAKATALFSFTQSVPPHNAAALHAPSIKKHAEDPERRILIKLRGHHFLSSHFNRFLELFPDALFCKEQNHIGTICVGYSPWSKAKCIFPEIIQQRPYEDWIVKAESLDADSPVPW